MTLTEMPPGYHLQVYDDCGEPQRQPHVVHGERCHTFAEARVDADRQARSVTWGLPAFEMVYQDLDPQLPWVLAVTYASERGNRRVQSLTAGGIELHGARELPDGRAERFLFRLPPQAFQHGRLALRFICHQGHNAVASIVELWAPRPSPEILRLELLPNVMGTLKGSVLDLAYQGVEGAQVTVRDTVSGQSLATAATGADGSFLFDASRWVTPNSKGELQVTARAADRQAQGSVPLSALYFVPPRYRPIATKITGVADPEILLDGVWHLHPDPPAGFQHQAPQGPGWADFNVPGQWLQQGFDLPPERTVGVATEFDIPRSWAGKRIFLRFDAVHAGTVYWLNGQELGSSEHLFTPVEFDITHAARPGERNRLALAMRVDTPSETASYSSDYAFHNLGGIDRSVRIFALPPVHLSRLEQETLLDRAYRDATLILRYALENATGAQAEGLLLSLRLEDAEGRPLRLPQEKSVRHVLPPGETSGTLRLPVANPLKWSAEKPYLYRLTVELHQDGKLLERLEQRVGFRQVEVRGSQLLLNGVPIKLAGVNRHEIDPLSGRAGTAKHAREDAHLLREANFNYIRTSHYPPTREFLEVCDEIGLYVECEAPFCWARGGRGEDDPRRTSAFLTPLAAMLAYHGDHPSVILWSLGNESGSGPDGPNRLPDNFAAMLEWGRREDHSRPFIFSNEWARDGGASDIAVMHYGPIPLGDCEWVRGDPRPVLMNEYFPPQTFTFAEELKLNPGLDVVNWSTGQNAPTSWWSLIYGDDRLIGGGIWAGIDEEFIFADGSVRGYGPWGFLDVWRRRKSLWWDAKRIHSPVWIPVRRVEWAPGQQSVQIPVENRYAFTDLSELKANWQLGHRRGDLKVSLPPASKGTFTVPIPEGTQPGSLLVLRFQDARRIPITAHGVTLGEAPPRAVPQPEAGCPHWRDDGETIAVTGNSFAFRLDRSSGDLLPIPDPRSPLPLQSFPMLFVARQEERNPFNPGGLPYAQYPDLATRQIDSITVEERGQALALVLRDRFRDFEGSVELLIDREGTARISFDYLYSGEAFTAAECGLRLRMDERCQEIRWRRRTEWDVYPEDHIGRPEGRAQAHGPAAGVRPPYLSPPPWPWHLDENEYGTRDFRTAKYHIERAELVAPDGAGLGVLSDGSATVRANLAPGGVQLHLLLNPPPVRLAPGDRLSGSFVVRLLRPAGR